MFVSSSSSAAGHNCVGKITQNFQPPNHGRAEFENSSFTFERLLDREFQFFLRILVGKVIHFKCFERGVRGRVGL